MQKTTSDYRCACGASMPHQAYRFHRRTCGAWQDASQVQIRLFEQYSARKIRQGAHIWTRHNAIVLGVAFYRANGILPSYRTCRTMYQLPDIKDILRIFGDVETFNVEIQAATLGEKS